MIEMSGLKRLGVYGLAYALLSVLVFVVVTYAQRPPAGSRRAILIRHGEKEGHKGEWENGLSYAGKMRAQCLTVLYEDLGITNLFAFNNKDTTRPVDTLTPLATKLQIPVDTQFKRGQMKQMAQYILTLPPNNISVVCWEHDRIKDIAHEMGIGWKEMPEDLMHFRSNFFDKEWSIYFDDSKGGGGSVKIVEQQQHCTYGVHYYGIYYVYWAFALGAPLLLLLVYVLLHVAAVCLCCGQKDAAERRLNWDHDAVDEPLLDEGG